MMNIVKLNKKALKLELFYLYKGVVFFLAWKVRLELTLAESESAVLPLDHFQIIIGEPSRNRTELSRFAISHITYLSMAHINSNIHKT